MHGCLKQSIYSVFIGTVKLVVKYTPKGMSSFLLLYCALDRRVHIGNLLPSHDFVVGARYLLFILNLQRSSTVV